MIEIDPQDRLLHSTGHKRPVGTIISLMLVAVTIFGAGIFYWVFVSQKFADVYKKLNIAPLPINIELRPEFYSRLDQLKREPCYRDAAIGLSDILLDAGYPRESATSILAFAERCGSKQNETILERAYVALNEVSDFSAAFKVVDQLVNSDPADAQYRYSRGATYEKLNIYSKALADYIAALQLSGTSSSPGASNVFYDISRMYAALGRYCDAIVPIETFISYKPAERRTPQTLKVISEYADRGNCDANYARGTARVRFLGVTGVRTVVAVINGISGNFLVDTGADYVSVTPEFSSRAKIKIESSERIPFKTVGGTASAEIGYASTVSLGSAEAQGVVIAIMRGPTDPFGGHLDGLLGMNFLARFDFHFTQDAIELSAVPLRGSAVTAAPVSPEPAGQQLTFPFLQDGSARNSFVQGGVDTCLKTQTAAPENRNLSQDQIIKFCGCYARAVADVVNGLEYEAIVNGKILDSFRGKAKNASLLCMRQNKI